MASKRKRSQVTVQESKEDVMENNKKVKSGLAPNPTPLTKPLKYKVGAIVRIKLHNFLTYDDAEVFPGAGLNVVLGPNGSGKSSIVAAICLGLGGSTKSLVRAQDERDYIKTNKQSGTIELELYKATPNRGRNVIIRRFLNQNQKLNYFTIDDAKVSCARLQRYVANLNIQVDNLCVFLAQERVVNFAKLSAANLLQETEKAADPQLYKDHMKLNDLRREEKQFSVGVQRKRQTLEALKKQQEEVEAAVARWREREEHIKTLDLIHRKLLWVNFETKRKEVLNIKQVKEDKEMEVQKAEATFGPLRNEERAAGQAVASVRAQYNSAAKKAGAQDKRRSDVQTVLADLESAAEDLDTEIRDTRVQLQRREKKVLETQNEIKELEEELKNLNTTVAQRELARVKEQLATARAERAPLQARRLELRTSLADVKAQQRRRHREMLELQSAQKSRMRTADDLTRGTAGRAFQWVESKRASFQGEVLGPVFDHIEIKDDKVAKYVENHIGYGLRMAYVCDRKEDWALLSDGLQQYKVRVIHVERIEPASKYKPYDLSQFTSQGYDLQYLMDALDMPGLVRQVLCDNASLGAAVFHAGPRALRPTELNKVLAKQNRDGRLRSLYDGDTNYSVKFSHYTGKPSTRSKRLREPVLFAGGSDQADLEEAKRLVGLLEAEFKEVLQQSKANEVKEKAASKAIQALEREKRHLQTQVKGRTAIQGKIRNARRRLSEYQDKKGLERKLQQQKRESASLNNQRVQLAVGLAAVLRQWFAHIRERDVLMLQSIQLQAKHEEAKEKLTQVDKEVKQLKEAAHEALLQYKSALRELKKKKKEAEKEANMDEYKERFAELPNTEEQLEHEKSVLTARIKAVVTNDEIVNQYELRQKEIKELDTELSEQEEKHAQMVQKISAKKTGYFKQVRSIVAKLDRAFAQYYEDIKCRGAVKLREDEDFDQCELQVMVAYRQDTELQQLSSHHQSGGERSVATMLFLLCLQHVTKTPFRVVDEINQGMDPKNERMIFDKIVESSSRTEQPQYFLVTPKLLPNLTYSAAIEVLVVHNGTGMLGQADWEFNRFMQQGQQMVEEKSA